MWDFITKPFVWILAIILGLMFWWMVTRLLFRAYYRSKLEFYQQLKKNKAPKEEK